MLHTNIYRIGFTIQIVKCIRFKNRGIETGREVGVEKERKEGRGKEMKRGKWKKKEEKRR
jgi:hypothetical protein